MCTSVANGKKTGAVAAKECVNIDDEDEMSPSQPHNLSIDVRCPFSSKSKTGKTGCMWPFSSKSKALLLKIQDKLSSGNVTKEFARSRWIDTPCNAFLKGFGIGLPVEAKDPSHKIIKKIKVTVSSWIWLRLLSQLPSNFVLHPKRIPVEQSIDTVV